RLSASLVDYSGATVAEETHRLATLGIGREALIAAAIDTVSALLSRYGGKARPLMRISLAVQGITDAEGSTLLWSPITRHGDIPFGSALKQAFGVPVTV